KISKREFKKDDVEGMVCNILLGDETGNIRVVLWNNEIEKTEGLRQGDSIRVTGFVKQGNFGSEIRVGRFGRLEKFGEGIRRRVYINELKEEGVYEIRAGLVQVFESSPFYEICSKCGLTLKEDESNYVCKTHGVVEPQYAMRVTGIIDDGSGSIRCVMFKEVAEKIVGVTTSQAKDIILRKGVSELFKNARVGEYVFSGKLKKNTYFDRLEFVINDAKEVDVKEEINLLTNSGF
ncbi:MAG: OB-fold nucleic acid binding domain-containing protein, partial [Candidatus Aenigmatarchaeota archaeon]